MKNEPRRQDLSTSRSNSNRRDDRFKPSPRDPYILRNRTVVNEGYTEDETDNDRVQQTYFYNWMIDTPRKLIATPKRWLEAGFNTPRRWLFSQTAND